METQAKHTPTPWERSSESAYKILTPGGGLLAETSYYWVDPLSARLNAEFIVNACNSHETMRELLDRAANHLQDMEAETGSDMNNYLAMEIWGFLQNT